MGEDRGRHDGHTLTRLVEDHGQSLMRLGYLLTRGDEAQAEDLLQTVLTALLARGIGDLESPLAFARRAMINGVRDTARRQATTRTYLPRLVETAPAPDPASGLADRMALFDALSQLSERERAVVILRYYEGMRDIEIAEILGCAVPTVRSHAHRAMPKLRALLQDEASPRSTGSREF